MMIWIWLGAIVLFGAVEAMTAGLVSSGSWQAPRQRCWPLWPTRP